MPNLNIKERGLLMVAEKFCCEKKPLKFLWKFGENNYFVIFYCYMTKKKKKLITNCPVFSQNIVQVEYFESETKEVEFQAKKMFQIWLENEADATPENLLYTLEGLGMLNSAQGIL
jgi:hypothetical protein